MGNSRRFLGVIFTSAIGMALLGLTGRAVLRAAPAEKTPPLPAAAELCASCHEASAKSWHLTPHRRTIDAPQVPKDQQGCTGCHRGTDKHLEDPTVEQSRPRMAGLSGKQIGERCLSCHRGGSRASWAARGHASLPQACLTCHSPHYGQGGQILKAPEPELCTQCHSRQKMESRLPSHHPIEEGKMVCTDCHNPHGGQRENLEGPSNTELCFRCHAEKEGPFAFEHPPVTEDCLTCHKPHGSQIDHLLARPEPVLCLQCHAGHQDGHRAPLLPFEQSRASFDVQQEARRAIAAFYTQCTSCHSRIHGTDLQSETGNGTFMPGGPSPFSDGGGAGAGGYGFSGRALKDTPTVEPPLRSVLPSVSPIDSTSGLGPAASWTLAELGLWRLPGAGVLIGDFEGRGNQQYVREYDGVLYGQPNVTAAWEQFTPTSDLHVLVHDPFAGDDDVHVTLGTRSLVLNVDYSRLTHRFGRFNDTGDALMPEEDGDGDGIIDPNNPNDRVGVRDTDLAEGKNDYGIERQVLSASAQYVLPSLPHVKLLANTWRETEQGEKQFLFLTRCVDCHKIQTTEPINRRTLDTNVGLDFALGRTAVRYLHNERRFENRAPGLDFNFEAELNPGVAPLIRVASTESDADKVRVTSDVTDSLNLFALWEDRDRRNEYSGVQLGIQTLGGGLGWTLAPDWVLTGSHFSSDFDVSRVTALIYNAFAPPPGLSPGPTERTSRGRDTTRLDLRYTGLNNATLSAGYRRELVYRTSDHEMLPTRSRTNYYTLSGIYTPTPRWWVQARLQDIRTSDRVELEPDEFLPSRLIGRPTDGSNWSLLTNYTLSDQLYAGALWTSQKEVWEVSADTEGKRNDSDIGTYGAFLYYTPTPDLTADLSYYRQRGRTTADVRYGTEEVVYSFGPGNEVIFWPIDSVATFNFRSSTLLAGSSWWATPRLRLFGRYAQTTSDGSALLHDIGDYLDLDPDLDGVGIVFNPFDLTIRDQWFGVGYLVRPDTEATLSYQRRSWDDNANTLDNGSFRVWRVGLMQRF